MKTLIALALLCATTTASANHALYTYGNPNTLQFCDTLLVRIAPNAKEGNYVAFQDCSVPMPDSTP